MWISVVIASIRRRDVLHETVLSLARQSRQADEILLSVVNPERDVKEETLSISGVRLLVGAQGLTFQRNTGVAHVHPDCDLIGFLDDDTELHCDYLRNACEFMARHPEVVAISDGGMIANGASTGELSRIEALRLVESSGGDSSGKFWFRSGLYGCDMIVRRSVAEKTPFDTRLPYEALYEDTDFGVRCARLGRLAGVAGCRLVHLASQVSRPSAKRHGYAHVMNGFYLWRKGSLSGPSFFRNTAKGLIADFAGFIVPRHCKTRAERRGQLWGSILGFRDIVIHGAQPGRIDLI